MQLSQKNRYAVDAVINNEPMIDISKLFVENMVEACTAVKDPELFINSFIKMCEWLKNSTLTVKTIKCITDDHVLDFSSLDKKDVDYLCKLANSHFLIAGSITNLLGIITPITESLTLTLLKKD